jgi:hypothetical protein
MSLGQVTQEAPPNYAITHPSEFDQMSAMVYNVLMSNVTFPVGRAIIKKHIITMDGRSAFFDLREHCTKSPIAWMILDNLRKTIMSARLTVSRGQYEAWLTGWRMKVHDFNNNVQDTRERLSEFTLKKFLADAVDGIPDFKNVRLRETERVVLKQPPFTYEEYYEALCAIATELDRTVSSHTRRSNMTAYVDDTEDDDEHQSELLVNRAFRRPFTPRLNKDTWNSLDPEDQTMWDKFSDEAKGKILAYTKTRDEQHQSKQQGTRTVNFHDTSVSDTEEAANLDDQQDDADAVSSDTNDREVNVTKTDVHPGHISRVLSGKAAQKESSRSASMAIRVHSAQRHGTPELDTVRLVDRDDSGSDSDPWDSISHNGSDASSVALSLQQELPDSDDDSDDDSDVPPLVPPRFYNAYSSDEDDDDAYAARHLGSPHAYDSSDDESGYDEDDTPPPLQSRPTTDGSNCTETLDFDTLDLHAPRDRMAFTYHRSLMGLPYPNRPGEIHRISNVLPAQPTLSSRLRDGESNVTENAWCDWKAAMRRETNRSQSYLVRENVPKHEMIGELTEVDATKNPSKHDGESHDANDGESYVAGLAQGNGETEASAAVIEVNAWSQYCAVRQEPTGQVTTTLGETQRSATPQDFR